MNSKKHKLPRRILAMLLAICMLVTMFPSAMFAVEGDGSGSTGQVPTVSQGNLDISKSKYATNLVKTSDGKYQSDITLSLPADSYRPSVDVVMVIDVSSSMKDADITEAKKAATAMCDELAAKENVDTKIGIVTFDKAANNLTHGLVSIEEAKSSINNIGTSSDTNMMAGLIAGKAMLDAGSGSDKYMVLMSDGIPIYWMENGEPTCKMIQTYNDNIPECPMVSEFPAGTEPEGSANNFETMLLMEQIMNISDSVWEKDSNIMKQSNNTGKILNSDEYKYTNIQKATYKTAKYLQDEIFGKYKLKMVAFGTDKYDNNVVYKYGENFCEWIGAKEGVSYYKVAKPGYGGEFGQLTQAFTDIADEMIYVVSAGSKVVDVMGSGTDNLGNVYDFNFVQDIEKLKLTVEGQELVKNDLTSSATLNTNETARYAFGEESDGNYPYILHYYQNGQDGNSAEYFVWDINESVEIDKAVQLTYTIELAASAETVGNHGTYDAYGELGGTSLYTNNSATLYPVDSNGTAGSQEEFAKPTVSYTVEEPVPEGTIAIQPADITIYTGGNSYESVVNGSGDKIGETNNGLPTPGFYITLPPELNQWMINNADSGDVTTVTVEKEDGTTAEQQVVDLSGYLTFTYNDGSRTTRVWELERYDNQTGNDSMAYSKYIYRIKPAIVNNEEIPIRLQFTNGSEFMTTDNFTVNLDGLYRTYDMTIYSGDLDQELVKAVLTVDGKENTFDAQVNSGELTIRGVTDQNTTTTDVVTETPSSTVDNITAQVPAGTNFNINTSDLEVASENNVELLVDSIVPDTNNTLYNTAVNYFDEITRDHAVQTNYLDLVDTSNGNAWVTAENDVTIHWPVPEDAADDSEFYIVHYTGLDRNDNNALDNYSPEDMELYSTDNDRLTVENGNITFTVASFSPFALFYTAEEDPGTGTDPDPGTDPDDQDTPALDKVNHFLYIEGYPEDYRTGEYSDNEDLWPVKPQGNITRAEVATIFYRLLKDEVREEIETDVNSFPDVNADDWFNVTVSSLANMNVISGYEDGTFRPNEPITRAELAAMAGRFYEAFDAEYEEGTFLDVEGDEWFADAIAAAAELGILGGYPDGTVRPNNNITRAETCAIVNRVLERRPHDEHLGDVDDMRTWPDNLPGAWYYADMQEATNGHYYEWIDIDGVDFEEWTEVDKDYDWTKR